MDIHTPILEEMSWYHYVVGMLEIQHTIGTEAALNTQNNYEGGLDLYLDDISSVFVGIWISMYA